MGIEFYFFNENKTYLTLAGFDKIRIFLSKFKISGALYFGKYFLLPRTEYGHYTVVGKALVLPKIENPTEDDVLKYHQMYIDRLKDLYDRYKHQYGASEELEIL